MSKPRRRRFRLFLLVLLLVAAFAGKKIYDGIYGAIIDIETESAAFYIPTGSNQATVLYELEEQNFIDKIGKLDWVMEQKNFKEQNIVPGKYTLRDGMSAAELVDHLRAGRGKEEVKVTFSSSRFLYDVAGKVARTLEADSLDLLAAFNNPEIQRKYGFGWETFPTMFLPDTYQMDWATDAEGFIARMAREYKAFWNEERLESAREIGLSQSKITILASIVQAEQQLYPDERPRIAGLYINRLNRGMRLQSDPTVVYAVGDFNINRVLTKHLSVDSPYNTYMYKGLPPGPINIPSKTSIDAVLNAEDNRYIYMCAKADFSGYHAFASTLSEHNRNARAFQVAMNQRGIYR